MRKGCIGMYRDVIHVGMGMRMGMSRIHVEMGMRM